MGGDRGAAGAAGGSGGGGPLGGEPPEALDTLEAELAEVCGQLNVLHARLVELTAQALAADAWVGWGIHSPSHWLAWKAGLSRSQASTIVRLAARRDELPVTFAAFAAGELSVDQVAPIVAKVPAWADAQVCELAREATVSQLRTVVARYPFDAEVPPAEDLAPDRPATPEAYVSLSCRDDGWWRLSGLLDAEAGRLVDTALREATDAVFRRDAAPAAQLDGLVEVAHRSLDTVVGTARRDRFRVHLHLDVTADTPVMTDSHGRAVPDWLAGLVTCDTTVTTTVERDGIPIGVGDTRPTIPAVVRRHVQRRDRGCRVPGCDARTIEVHHIHYREHGGDHDPANLVAVCARHHRLHHRGHLGITGNAQTPHGLVFTDPWGRPLHPASTARPPTRPPPQPTHPYPPTPTNTPSANPSTTTPSPSPHHPTPPDTHTRTRSGHGPATRQ